VKPSVLQRARYDYKNSELRKTSRAERAASAEGARSEA